MPEKYKYHNHQKTMQHYIVIHVSPLWSILLLPTNNVCRASHKSVNLHTSGDDYTPIRHKGDITLRDRESSLCTVSILFSSLSDCHYLPVDIPVDHKHPLFSSSIKEMKHLEVENYIYSASFVLRSLLDSNYLPVDVHVDGLLGVFRLQEEELCDHQACYVVINLVNTTLKCFS